MWRTMCAMFLFITYGLSISALDRETIDSYFLETGMPTVTAIINKMGTPNQISATKSGLYVEYRLVYPGVKYKVWDFGDDQKTMYWLDIEQPGMDFLGVKVGSSISAVRNLFGDPTTKQKSAIWEDYQYNGYKTMVVIEFDSLGIVKYIWYSPIMD